MGLTFSQCILTGGTRPAHTGSGLAIFFLYKGDLWHQCFCCPDQQLWDSADLPDDAPEAHVWQPQLPLGGFVCPPIQTLLRHPGWDHEHFCHSANINYYGGQASIGVLTFILDPSVQLKETRQKILKYHKSTTYNKISCVLLFWIQKLNITQLFSAFINSMQQ